MRILIAGTGGVGGYFGALLARAGHDVVFLARGGNLAALRERGLTVESVDGDVRLPQVTATDTLAGEAPERHRLLVRLPPELGIRNPLEQPPRGRHLVIEFRQQRILQSHRLSFLSGAAGRRFAAPRSVTSGRN